MNRHGLSVVSSNDAPRAPSIISIATEQLSRLTYRVKAGKLTSVSAIRDRGIALIYDGDVSTGQSALQNYILPGHARTCIAEGLVVLGGVPDEPITLDGEGTGLEQRRMEEWRLAGAVEKSYVEDLAKAGLLIGDVP